MPEIAEIPPPKLDIGRLFKLHDMFMDRAWELSVKAVVTGQVDNVSMHVNLSKLKEIQRLIKVEWEQLNDIINHP